MQIVHHSNYIRFFEEARLDFLEKIGISYAEIERMGYVVPVLSVSAEYKSMTRYGETLAICVKFEEFNGLRFAFTYRVFDVETKTLRATGKTVHCYLKDGKPVHLKRELPDLYHTMMEQVGWESEL
jgi:acyl-CoA thioester hydrolase